MAVEFDVKCAGEMAADALLPVCRSILRERLCVTDAPEVRADRCGDILVLPRARVGIVYYEVPLVDSPPEDEEEAGSWVCISMNPSRTDQSFLLAIAIAIAMAEANATKIVDDIELMRLGRVVRPADVRFDLNPGTFVEVANRIGRLCGLPETWR